MALIELQKLRGIGEKAAEKLWDRGIKSRADVQREAASLELPDATRAHLRYAWAEKVPRVAVEEIAALVKAAAHEAYGGRLSVEPTGSHRRGLAFSSDVDLLCVLENPESRTEHHDVLKRLVPLLKSAASSSDLNREASDGQVRRREARRGGRVPVAPSVCEFRGAGTASISSCTWRGSAPPPSCPRGRALQPVRLSRRQPDGDCVERRRAQLPLGDRHPPVPHDGRRRDPHRRLLRDPPRRRSSNC